MKLLLLSLLASVALCAQSCNGNKQTSNVTEQSPTENVQPEEKEKAPEFSIKIKKYQKNCIFQLGKKKVYHENNIYVEWPVSGKGFDVKALQSALISCFNIENKDIEKYVNDWAMEATADDGYEGERFLVKKKDEHRYDNEEEEDDDDDVLGLPMYDTGCSMEIVYKGYDANTNIVTFQCFSVVNNGCGMGSCIFPNYEFFTFDTANNHVVSKEDIIANDALAAKELKKQRIGADEYGGLEGLDNIEELPDEFYIDGDNFYSAFTKYEISFGADGCPILGFDVRKCPQVLTPYGKKLFGIK